MDLTKKTYLLVTGASRGIGQTIATRLAAKLKTDSVVVLLARSLDGMAITEATIEAEAMSAEKVIKVLINSVDLETAKASQFQHILSETLESVGKKPGDFERAIIIHNAGTVGDVSKRAIDVSDTDIWTKFYHMNVFSMIALNCEFFRTFAAVPKLVVNLSSKCGIEPFESMSFYCSSKAAREMYFRVLAAEEANKDTLVLNYAPGAIDTDMALQVQNESINAELAASFAKQRVTKTMLTTEQTTERFIEVLEEKKFTSGDHVDYWD